MFELAYQTGPISSISNVCVGPTYYDVYTPNTKYNFPYLLKDQTPAKIWTSKKKKKKKKKKFNKLKTSIHLVSINDDDDRYRQNKNSNLIMERFMF